MRPSEITNVMVSRLATFAPVTGSVRITAPVSTSSLRSLAMVIPQPNFAI
ncbi:unannotated protein [freshwater metagenome]|uniref:Unannotated protein n=1 Tax=freshwater metagenome TaxID=449393 RepID=A0A6J6M2J6_9ZZZZ